MEFSTRLFLSCILSLTDYTTANTPWRIVTTERQTYFVPCPSVGQGQSGKYMQECKSSGTGDKEDRVYKEEESHCIMQQNSHRFRNLVSPTKTVRVKSKLCECSRKKRNAQRAGPILSKFDESFFWIYWYSIPVHLCDNRSRWSLVKVD